MSEQTTILVLAATQAELEHLTSNIARIEVHREGARDVAEAMIGPVRVICLRTGIGITAAAAATEFGISRYQPSALINFGSAGAHVRDIVPGDVVIGDRTVAYGTMQILPDGQEIHIDQQFTVGVERPHSANSINEVDAWLADLASQLSKGWVPAPWPAAHHYAFQPERLPMVRRGVVISADVWVQNPARIDVLHLRHNSLCADMEAAAIAQIAKIHRTPFITIKDITNNEFYQSTNISMGAVSIPFGEVGRRSAVLVSLLIDRLSENP